ncbi:MAG: hypothetical protein MZW92_66645 [Comamonadaceae bacterium]|nr:hypothetical protein [Comamonadaceae bacterium]
MLAGERVRAFQWLALVLAVGGHRRDRRCTPTRDSTPLGPGAGARWRRWPGPAATWWRARSGRVDMLGYVVWSSLFALPPLLAAVAVVRGPGGASRAALARGRRRRPGRRCSGRSLGNTLFGYAAWGWLLARHPAATVAPMALLVPVFGMARLGAGGWASRCRRGSSPPRRW